MPPSISLSGWRKSVRPSCCDCSDKHPSLVHYAVVVFGHSPWLGETLIHNPDLFYGFARERSLDRTHSREEFQEDFARMRSRSFETDTAALLARFKRREYVRIMLRDVLGIATLAETTAEISALADVLIEEALREADSQLQHRFGTPQRLDREGRVVDSRFAVLSLGKLGGNELNYSSDIDLLYLYDGGEEPAGAEISNREYFIRLAQQTTELLSRHTREGPVFRIDLRLRPQGNEGEPAVSAAACDPLLLSGRARLGVAGHDQGAAFGRRCWAGARVCAGGSAFCVSARVELSSPSRRRWRRARRSAAIAAKTC